MSVLPVTHKRIGASLKLEANLECPCVSLLNNFMFAIQINSKLQSFRKLCGRRRKITCLCFFFCSSFGWFSIRPLFKVSCYCALLNINISGHPQPSPSSPPNTIRLSISSVKHYGKCVQCLCELFSFVFPSLVIKLMDGFWTGYLPAPSNYFRPTPHFMPLFVFVFSFSGWILRIIRHDMWMCSWASVQIWRRPKIGICKFFTKLFFFEFSVIKSFFPFDQLSTPFGAQNS